MVECVCVDCEEGENEGQLNGKAYWHSLLRSIKHNTSVV